MGLTKGWSGLLMVVIIHGCMGSTFLPQAFAQRVSMEYQLKAAYLAKLPHFVQWPKRETAPETTPSDVIRLCVMGNYPFGTLLVQEGNRIPGEKRIQVHSVGKLSDLKGCQIIFVSGSSRSNYEKALNASRGMNALTVGESDGFLEAGGIVELNYENDTLKFKVNLDAAQASQLKLDARLLVMAQRVIREKGQSGK